MDKQREMIKNLLDEANAALLQGQQPLAVTIADAILSRKPDYPQGYSIKFKALILGKEFEKARQIGAKAAALNPTSEYILNNQACLELDAGNAESSIKLLNSLLEQYGDQPSWLYNLGLAYRQCDHINRAIEVFNRVLDCKPDHDKAAFQLVECLLASGQLEEALVKQNYLRLLRSTHPYAHSVFINLAVNTGEFSAAQLKQEARLWKKRFIPKGLYKGAQPKGDNQQLTIGFLVAGLPNSWLQQILAPLVNALAEGGDKIFVYAVNHGLSENPFSVAVSLIPSASLSDLDFVERVRADQIDTLVDVCGFNLGERQSAFGVQAVSKQVGWLAHPGYYASDLIEIIDKDAKSLPLFIQLNQASQTADSDLLPSNTLAAIGCKQGISNFVMRTWAEVLTRQPSLNLHLDTSDPTIIQNLQQRFRALGISAERLSFAQGYHFNHESVVVDNFLINDIVEIAQALSSGACVVALDGVLFPAKRSAELLRQLGRAEWISTDRVNYVAKVIQQLNEQLKNPVTEAEIKDSGLQDLDAFAQQFRAKLTLEPSDD